MVLHPNAGAVVVARMRNNQPDVFREFLGEFDERPREVHGYSKVGDEYEEMEILRDLYAKASKTNAPMFLCRTACGIEMRWFRWFLRHYSKPAIGYVLRFPDCTRYKRIDRSTGNVRCRNHPNEPLQNEELFEQTVHLINDFKEYFLSQACR